MPRKAKEKIEELNIEKTPKKVNIKKAKVDTSKVSKKEAKSSKATSSQKKTSTKKKVTSTNSKKETKTNNTKKVAKATSTSSKKRANSNVKSVIKPNTKKTKSDTYISEVEYYDLPFRYNETVVKILAQTPNTLFIYWDISDEDRNKYIEKYGSDFFYTTKPILVITNKTLNYTFEVEINDFANSWYLHVNDANCDYQITLVRKTITYSENISDDFIHIYSSNKVETPNNHILLDKLGKTVFFRNVKTSIVEEKSISSLSCLKRVGKIYDIYDLYKEIYKEELTNDTLGVNLSSSSSSTFK